MVSIVVPVHNAGQYIAETIRSVCQQTFPDWELILVDDASTDDSVEQIRKTAAAVSPKVRERIRLICRNEAAGPAGARNTGTRAAKGEYLAFLDADDLWYPEKLARELRFLQEESAAFVCTSYQFGDAEGRPTGRAVHVPPSLTFRRALTRTVIFTSTVLIDRRQVPPDLQLMPEIASEDTAAWWRILQHGFTARGLDELLVVYRRPAASLSSDKGKAVGRIWQLYRKIAGLGRVQAAFCLLGWAWRAAWRRIVPDHR